MNSTNNTGTKYPRQLAINETSSRRQIDQIKNGKIKAENGQYELFGYESETPLVTEYRNSLYTLGTTHAVIFDGLCKACTSLYDTQWEDSKTGKWHDLIGRKDDITETHYRLFAPDSLIKDIFAGPYENEWHNIRNQLMKLALHPEPKKLIIDEKHFIIDAPIKVTPWYEKDNIEKFTNLSPRRKGKGLKEAGKAAREATGERETGKAKGQIIGWSIEFFKPLFEPLLLINSGKRKTSVGKNYFITPPYFQMKVNAIHKGFLAGTDSMIDKKPEQIEAFEKKQVSLFPQKEKEIRMEAEKYKRRLKEYYEDLKNKVGSITPLQIRCFYMGLLTKDNHKGDYITIDNLVEFVDGIWPGLIRIDSNGHKTLQPAHYNEAIDKIKLILNVYFKTMADRGDMDGGQLLPLAIIEGEEFSRETNRIRIQCIKKNTMFSKYRLEEIAQYLVHETSQGKAELEIAPK